MTLHVHRYELTPQQVEAVELTADNMAEAAEWCAGTYHPPTRHTVAALQLARLHEHINRAVADNKSGRVGDTLSRDVLTGTFRIHHQFAGWERTPRPPRKVTS